MYVDNAERRLQVRQLDLAACPFAEVHQTSDAHQFQEYLSLARVLLILKYSGLRARQQHQSSGPSSRSQPDSQIDSEEED